MRNKHDTCTGCDQVFSKQEMEEHQLNCAAYLALQFQCAICTESFGLRMRLHTHMVSQHSTCSGCLEAVPQDTISQHNRSCPKLVFLRSRFWHQCQHCPAGFPYKRQFRIHQTQQHGIKPEHNYTTQKHPCRICGELYYKANMKRHEASHTIVRSKSIKQWVCEQCGKVLSSKGSLEYHAKSMHRENNKIVHRERKKKPSVIAKCEVCGKVFHNKHVLKKHVDGVHLGKKPPKKFICDVCGKAHVNSSFLRYHKYTHTGETPYGCTQCHKAFTNPAQLASHRMSHSDVRPFPCQLCTMAFKNREKRKHHVWAVHENRRAFQCDRCSLAFVTKSSLSVHYRTHTFEKRYTCEICDRRFMRIDYLKKHRNTHRHFDATNSSKPQHRKSLASDSNMERRDRIETQTDHDIVKSEAVKETSTEISISPVTTEKVVNADFVHMPQPYVYPGHSAVFL